MPKSAGVAGILLGFAAACELRGYPSWVDRKILSRHVATAERILDGARPAAEESRGERTSQLIRTTAQFPINWALLKTSIRMGLR